MSLTSKVARDAVRMGADPRLLRQFSESLVRMERTRWAIQGDPDLFRLFNRGTRARNTAASNLAKRRDFVLLPFGNPNANRALALMGKQMGKAARDRHMINIVIPAAILQAACELTQGDQRNRGDDGFVPAAEGREGRDAFRRSDLSPQLG